MNKHYRLRIQKRFWGELDNAVDYITYKLKNPEAARKLAVDAIQEIQQRQSCAETFMPYRSEKSGKLYYKIFVKNFVVVYRVIDGVMEVQRFLYKRRNTGQLV